MKPTIYLNAGHSLTDPGTITEHGKESVINQLIRDALIPELTRNSFLVMKIPDDLNLGNSIEWVNQKTTFIDDGLALSIHCNQGGGEGAEAYYYGNSYKSKGIAQKLIDEYCKETGLRNRGAKSDTTTHYGKLGWIRNTNIWATLIEVGFLDNYEDIEKIQDFERTARGIAKGVCKIYGVEYKEEPTPTPDFDKEAFKKKIIDFIHSL